MAQALHDQPNVSSRPIIVRHALGVGVVALMCAVALACAGDKKKKLPAPVTESSSRHLFDQFRPLLAVFAKQDSSEANAKPAEIAPDAARLRVHVSGARAETVVHLLSGASVDGDSLVTDSQGYAHFESPDPGHYQLWASSPGMASELVTMTQGSEPSATVELTLAPATLVRGRVHDEGGDGILARLTLIPIGHESAPRRVQTGVDGSFALASLPRGAWRIQVAAENHTLQQGVPLDARAAEQAIDLSLVKNASIAGRVTTMEGDTVSDALVRITRLDAGESQEQRFTTIGGPRWVHPLPGARQMPLRDTRRFGAARDGVRPMECGAGHCGVDLGGKRGWPVMAAADGVVVVSSRDDRGKAGRYVAIEHAGGFRSFYMHLDSIAESVEMGLAIPAGTQLGTLGRSGVVHSEPHLHFALSRQELDSSYFLDPEPMLGFAVLLAMPQELSTTSDLLIADLDSPPLHAALASSGARKSDPQGRFASGSLPPGRYLVQVVHPDLAPGHSESFTLAPGQRLADLQIKLSAGQRLSGRILGLRGKAPGAWLRAYQGEGESRQLVARAQADSDGYFAMRPLMGAVELEAGAPGFGVATRQVSLGRRTLEKLNFDLSAFDSQLRGQIVDPMGRALSGAYLQILDGPGGRGRRVVSDTDGLFVINALAAGSYRIRVRSNGFPDFEREVETNKVGELKLVQGGALRLVLRDRHSREPLSGLRVLAKGPRGQSTTAISGKDGHLEWPALSAGTWQVSIASDRHSPFTAAFKISASEQAGPIREIELERGSTVAGILLDANGDRVNHARVWMGASETFTDLDGRFRLEQVASGKNLLRAETESSSATLPITLFAGDEYLTLDLRLGVTF